MAAWWERALQHWCALAGLAPDVRTHGLAYQVRPVGTWWASTTGETLCCVELSAPHYASFAMPVDKPRQDALTWMLQRAFATHDAGPPVTIAAQFAHWVDAPTSELIAAVALVDSQTPAGFVQSGRSSVIDSVAVPLVMRRQRGYLLWLHFSRETQSSRTDDREFTQTAEDVIEAFDPGSWREWLATPNSDGSGARTDTTAGGTPSDAPSAGATTLLAFISEAALEAYASREDPKPQGADPDPGQPTRPDALYPLRLREVVRSFAGDLMQMIEADALTSCTITISQMLLPLQDANHSGQAQPLDAALASLVLAQRGRSVGLRRDRIAQFGDDALLHLVQSLSPAGRAMLGTLLPVRVGDPRGPESGDAPVSPTGDTLADLPETLQAMVAANLNVSEAARLLYLHRNTLQNRIERVREVTGRDLRNFDDAASLLLSLLAHHASRPHLD